MAKNNKARVKGASFWHLKGHNSASSADPYRSGSIWLFWLKKRKKLFY